MHLPAGHWEDCYTRRLLFVYFFLGLFFWISCRSVHYKRGGTTQQCAGTNFYFLQQWPEQTAHVSGKQTFTSSSGFPPVSRSRERLAPGFPDREGIQISTTRTVFAQTYTHKGRDPQQPTNKKVEIDPRAASRRTSPRPLSLSPFSSRRDIQPRGALRVPVRIDFLRWYPRALLPLLPQPAPPSLFCVQIDGRNGCGREREKKRTRGCW